MTDDRHTPDRLRWAHRWEREQAEPFGQGLLPFADQDGHLADEEPEFHGTSVGLRRHLAADEPLCTPCRVFVDELAAGGYAHGSHTPTPDPKEVPAP